MAQILLLVLLAAMAAVSWRALRVIRAKNLDIIWRGRRPRTGGFDGTTHVFFCFVDHYEPYWAGASPELARQRVDRWVQNYAKVVDGLRDNGGRPPQHNFFYPQEEYDPECLERLEKLVRAGYGDVEVHLHHDNDTSAGFRAKIVEFTNTLRERHGLLREGSDGRPAYGFIHGNWALDDTGAGGRWCGVRDEIQILRDTGCYADFTYPSAPHPSQPPTINQIYTVTDDPGRAGSHHRGVEAAYGQPLRGDLTLITGPLALNWRQRRRGVFPAIENGDITGNYVATPDRIDLWIKTAIGVRDWPSWRFVKVHTHGCQENNARVLLGREMSEMYRYLLQNYNDGARYVMHFVTAWEMFCCVDALARANQAAIASYENFRYVTER